jgi:hypothetical protein
MKRYKSQLKESSILSKGRILSHSKNSITIAYPQDFGDIKTALGTGDGTDSKTVDKITDEIRAKFGGGFACGNVEQVSNKIEIDFIRQA